MRLEIVTDDRYVDLVEEGFDVAIRAKPEPHSDLAGRCVLRDRLVAVASPALTRPEPSTTGEPTRAPAVVRALGENTPMWTLEDGGRRLLLDPDPVLRLSTLAIRDAVRAGAGVALFPSYFVRDDLAEGQLVSWGALVGEPLEFWVLHASARLASSKVRAFTDLVVETFTGASL